MRKLLFIFALMLSLSLNAQKTYGTWGTDFWLAYLTNWYDTDVDEFTISICGPRNCTCTISNPNTGWSYIMNVSANTMTDYQLPSTQCNPSGSCVVNNSGLHITATDSVQVFAFTHSGSPSTSDAVALYTTQSLGPEYVVQTYPFTASTAEARAEFCILAILDSTTVDIMLSGSTSTGVSAGSTLTVTLQAGQVYQVKSPQSPGNADFSGTVVTTFNHGCKPFALFMGNTVTNVPFNSNISSDHCYTQALPTLAWPNQWIIAKPNWYNATSVRVTAQTNGTRVYKNGTMLTTINRGQTYEFQTTSDCLLETSQPSQVVQYLYSRYNSLGDASAYVPNALNCHTHFTAIPYYPLNNHVGASPNYYVDVVYPTSERSLLRLNNSTISGVTPRTVPNTNYSIMSIPITGSAKLSTTGSGFMAYTYGLAENWESYALALGGIGLVPSHDPDTVVVSPCHKPYMFMGQAFTDDGEYQFVSSCIDTTRLFLTFNAPDTIMVDTMLCGDRFVWHGTAFTTSGQYTLIGDIGDDGCDSLFLIHLQLHPTFDTLFSQEWCDSLYTHADTTLRIVDSISDFILSYHSIYGCDSITRLHLEKHRYFTELYDGSCDSIGFTFSDTMLSVPGDYMFAYTTDNRCDSNVLLHLQFYPSYDFLTVDSIYYGHEYAWIEDYVFDDDIDITVNYLTIHDCDSIYRLILHFQKPPTSYIWPPNVITPNGAQNRTFRVLSDGVDEMTVSIFQRWGDHVCTFDGLTGEWDGTYKGIPCQQATYVYIIRYHKEGGLENPMPICGTVTLLR